MITCRMPKGKMMQLIAMLLVLLSVAMADHKWTAAAADSPQSERKTDNQRLLGRWIRPDGGYVLELKQIGKDGSLKAAYFNPRPINVSRAELLRKKGKMGIFIELRDINYPGSNYKLRYDPASDRLTGTYFQAIERQLYEVEFVRAE